MSTLLFQDRRNNEGGRGHADLDEVHANHEVYRIQGSALMRVCQIPQDAIDSETY
jgi:hypothetical protein